MNLSHPGGPISAFPSETFLRPPGGGYGPGVEAVPLSETLGYIPDDAGGNIQTADLILVPWKRINSEGTIDKIRFNGACSGTVCLESEATVASFVLATRELAFSGIVVRSPFGAKHHVAVQFMARWMKCPLPPCPSPNPPPLPLPDPPPPARPPPPAWPPPKGKTRRTRKNQRHYRQGTSHCSCLEHCFLFVSAIRASPALEDPPKSALRILLLREVVADTPGVFRVRAWVSVRARAVGDQVCAREASCPSGAVPGCAGGGCVKFQFPFARTRKKYEASACKLHKISPHKKSGECKNFKTGKNRVVETKSVTLIHMSKPWSCTGGRILRRQ